MTTDMQRRLAISLANVRVRFLEMLDERLGQLTALQTDLHQPHMRAAALEAISAIAHKIAGTAGTLGFERLGLSAIATEDLIRLYFATGEVGADALDDRIAQFCADCAVHAPAARADNSR